MCVGSAHAARCPYMRLRCRYRPKAGGDLPKPRGCAEELEQTKTRVDFFHLRQQVSWQSADRAVAAPASERDWAIEVTVWGSIEWKRLTREREEGDDCIGTGSGLGKRRENGQVKAHNWLQGRTQRLIQGELAELGCSARTLIDQYLPFHHLSFHPPHP